MKRDFNPNPRPILLVALGGNALIKKGQAGTIDEQFQNLQSPMAQIARLSRDFRVIITHGNGPQVGNLLLQQEACQEVPHMPLEILVAQTEGQVGYMIESTLDGELMALGIHQKPLVSLITYVVVNQDDPAFRNPSKPIGPLYAADQVDGLPFGTVRTAKGYRRVVASPEPVTIIEKREIKKLIDQDFVVICCGGGGIPVVREGRAFSGVDAVIDKDLASALLACEVGVDVFVIATDVPAVALDYGTPDQRSVDHLTFADARTHLQAGQFAQGSMGPKVEAMLRFMEHGGKQAVIASIEALEAAVQGSAGTRFGPPGRLRPV